MTPRQIIASHIRQHRTIPPGSIIWLHANGLDDLVSIDEVGCSLDSWLKKIGSPPELTIHLDTPEGDFEDQWCLDTSIFKHAPPVREVVEPAKVIARRERVAVFGEKMIATAEHVIHLYTDYLANMFCRDFGYVGKKPLVRVNWAAKNSWGGHRNITISPGYLYETDLVEIYGLRMFARIRKLAHFIPLTGLTTLRRWWLTSWLTSFNSILHRKTIINTMQSSIYRAWITVHHTGKGGSSFTAILKSPSICD